MSLPYGIVLVTGSVEEPITLEEAKVHCRVDPDITEDDEYLRALIAAARDKIERDMDLSLVKQTWRLSFDRFPAWEIRIPRSPLIAVTTLKYYDTSGTLTTLSSSTYEVDTDSRPSRIQPAWGYSWPATRNRTSAVQVTFTAGFGTSAASVPAGLRQAVKLLVSHWYTYREPVLATGAVAASMPLSYDALVASHWSGTYA